jgi:hypothetical protein
MTSSGRYSTARITESHNGALASTLSQVLEDNPDRKYFVHPQKVTRILASASMQKPQLLALSQREVTPEETTQE